MSDKKITDEEIIRNYEWCIGCTSDRCRECTMDEEGFCEEELQDLVLDLINRQKAEIEKLTDKLRVARIAAYMDFIEKLKEKQASPTHTMDKRIVSFQMIEDTVLELIKEDFPDIEKLVFPTREEAEQTLRGRESK